MSRGTLDGALIGYQSAVSYDLISLLKSATLNEPLSSVVITYSIGNAKWKALPEGVQKVLAEEGERVTKESCAKFARAEQQAIERAREKGVKLIEFSPEDDKTMSTVFESVNKRWASGLDGRGKPGSEALKVWKDALSAAANEH